MAKMLTSQDILHAEFKKTMRGYDTKEVDYFLDEIVGTFELYNEKISKLEAEIEKNKQQLDSFEQTRELMQSTLLMAQKSAEARVEKARQDAKKIIEDAQKEAEDIRNGAYNEKSELHTKLENIRKLREDYMTEAKEMVSRFGELLNKCEQPTEVAKNADEFISSFEAEKPAEDKAEVKVEIASEGLRFEYEEEKTAAEVVPNETEILIEETIPKQENNENAEAETEFEPEAEAEKPAEEKAAEDELTLSDSEEQIKKDAEAEIAAKKTEKQEDETEDLAQAERVSFTDENQSNLFGEDAEPTKAAKEIHYAEKDDLDF